MGIFALASPESMFKDRGPNFAFHTHSWVTNPPPPLLEPVVELGVTTPPPPVRPPPPNQAFRMVNRRFVTPVPPPLRPHQSYSPPPVPQREMLHNAFQSQPQRLLPTQAQQQPLFARAIAPERKKNRRVERAPRQIPPGSLPEISAVGIFKIDDHEFSISEAEDQYSFIILNCIFCKQPVANMTELYAHSERVHGVKMSRKRPAF